MVGFNEVKHVLEIWNAEKNVLGSQDIAELANMISKLPKKKKAQISTYYQRKSRKSHKIKNYLAIKYDKLLTIFLENGLKLTREKVRIALGIKTTSLSTQFYPFMREHGYQVHQGSEYDLRCRRMVKFFYLEKIQA